jgi:hypothetical protein
MTRALRALTAPLLAAPLLLAAPATAALAPEPPSDSLAAREGRAAWRLAVGPNAALLQLRDDLLAPLRYTGPALGGRVVLERTTSGSEQRAELRLGAGIGFNRMGHGAGALPWGGSLTALRRAASSRTGERELRLGAALLAHVDAVYFYDWDDAHLYWMTSYAAGPLLSLRRIRGERKTELALALPVVGVVARPPEVRYGKVDDLVFVSTWLTLPHRGFRAATWPALLLADARLAHDLSRKTRLRYDLSFRTTSRPRRAAVLAHEVGVEWTVGGGR